MSPGGVVVKRRLRQSLFAGQNAGSHVSQLGGHANGSLLLLPADSKGPNHGSRQRSALGGAPPAARRP